MSKTTVTRLFIGSGIAIVAGAILSIAAIWLAIANDVFVMSGPDIVGDPRQRARLVTDRFRHRRRASPWPAARSAASCRGSARC